MDIESLKERLPLLWTFLGFCAGLLILFLIFDSWIFPSLIHNTNKVAIPNVTGMSVEKAQAILESVDLNFHISSKQFNDEYPINQVINQHPKPNTVVKCGRHINLIISKGGESVTIPDIKGKPMRFARVSLMERGIYIGSIEYVFNDSIGVDTVISQSIRPGRKINFGTYVNITVSKGLKAEIEVPVLIGKTISEVESILESHNLQLGKIGNTSDEIYSATYLRNTIIDQFPPPGEIVTANSKINITIYR